MYSTLQRSIVALSAVLIASWSVSIAQAQVPDKNNLRGGKGSVATSPNQMNPATSVLDVNNMTTWLREDGFFPWISDLGFKNGQIPKGQAGSVFAQGIMWGGKVKDGNSPTVRVNGSTYQIGLNAGPVPTDAEGRATGMPGDCPDCHVWRVHRNWETLDYTQKAAQFFHKAPGDVTDQERQQIREQYEHDWNQWPAEWGAPYEDVNGDGVYDPDEDIPGYPGADQTLWIVANDLGQGVSERSYGSPSIGLEYQLTIWGYERASTDALGNMHFARARLIYTGRPGTPEDARIDSMFLSQWVDPDVGSAGDDFAGTDTTRSLGYAYNANPSDDQYDNVGLPPASVGWDFLQGPVSTEGDTLGMTSFVYFAAGSDVSDPDLSDYSGSLQWYNLMRGVKPRPAYPAAEPFINPLNGRPSRFTLPGDPVTGSGWIDGMQLPPGDRRLVLTTGPFSMELGDTSDVVIGQIGAVGTNNLSSVSLMKFYDVAAQNSYDNEFEVQSPPSMPPVQATAVDGKAVLNWGRDHQATDRTESFSDGGYEFEGYRVYQLPSADAALGDGTLVATYDRKNDISTLWETEFNQETGFPVEKPVQNLPNAGIQRFRVFTQDAIRQRPLANGNTYHYAITAFAYMPRSVGETTTRILQSTPVTVSVTPQPPEPGVSEGAEPATEVQVSHSGTSTSTVSITNVDPQDIVTGEYSLQFGYYNPYTGSAVQELSPGDTLREIPDGFFENTKYSSANAYHTGDSFPLRWQLTRDGSAVSDWMPQIDPAGSVTPSAAPIVNGMRVYVEYVSPTIDSLAFEGDSWISGVNAGLAALGGGLDLAHFVFGSDLSTSQLDTVAIEFQADRTSGPENGWGSRGAVYLRGNGYAYEDIGNLPIQAYAIDGSERRKLNVSYVENTADCSNLLWDMGADAGSGCQDLGGREYLFVHNTDYDAGATYEGVPGGFAADAMYFIWPSLAGDYLANEFTMTIYPAVPNSTEDSYSFQAQGRSVGSQEDLEAAVDEINVFPNPYVGYSALEESRHSKRITFTHLPDQATIRIFTLDGTMVRVLQHSKQSQFEEWDLTNEDGIPVASGVYLAHVETQYGEKILKVAIVQEEQILERY